MATKKDTKETKAAHSTSSRTEVQADGTIGAFYTVDGSEMWIGSFADENLAKIETDKLIASVEARWEYDVPAEPEAETAK